jgi:hypothetical protein
MIRRIVLFVDAVIVGAGWVTGVLIVLRIVSR